jgi:hypothetical protein
MQMRFIKRVRFVPLTIVSLLLVGVTYFFFAGDSFRLENQTFKGTTAMKSLVVLNLSVEDGKVTGHGYHVYSSGYENYVAITGFFDESSRRFSLTERHVANGKLYGEISGRFSEDAQHLSAKWINPKGNDPTSLHLQASDLRPEVIVEQEGPKTVEKKAIAIGKKAKQAVGGFFKGLFSD